MIMKRKLIRNQSAKVSLKMEERKIRLLEGAANALATPKALQGKTLSSFTMYVEDKLKQMDARSRPITKKRIMDILFEVEMRTTCVTPTQRQYSISMRSAEAQYSNATTPIQGTARVVHCKLKTSGWIYFKITDFILF